MSPNTVRQILLLAFFSGTILMPQFAKADWKWWGTDSETGHKKYSPEWYCAKAQTPPGDRAKCKHGKQWPPFARPTVPQQTWSQQYHSTHYWPLPYNEQDRELVNQWRTRQIASGWRTATTLHEYHFDSDTQDLTTAGRKHILWILQQAPEYYRNAYVAANHDLAVNQSRISHVQNYVAALTGSPDSLPVSLRIATPMNRSGLEIDTYQRAWNESMIPPRITYDAESASGSN